MAKTLEYTLILIVCLLAAGCKGNVQGKHETAPPKSDFLYHRVQPGDTLAGIAKKYTGHEDYWRELVKYNPSLKTGRLQRGELIKVPVSIAHNSKVNGAAHSEAPPEDIFGPR